MSRHRGQDNHVFRAANMCWVARTVSFPQMLLQPFTGGVGCGNTGWSSSGAARASKIGDTLVTAYFAVASERAVICPLFVLQTIYGVRLSGLARSVDKVLHASFLALVCVFLGQFFKAFLQDVLFEKVFKDGHWRVSCKYITFEEVFGEGAERDYC